VTKCSNHLLQKGHLKTPNTSWAAQLMFNIKSFKYSRTFIVYWD